MSHMIYRDALADSCAKRCYIGKMAVSVVTMTQTLDLFGERVRKKTPAYICAANLEAAALAQRDASFCTIQNGSFLTLPDGIPLVWYARITGESAIERVTGPDLLIEALKLSSQRGFTHYFYGDTEETLTRLSQVVRNRFPGAVVKGLHSPPFRELTNKELHAAAEEINKLKPSIVWVGLGCPRQERWMAKVLPYIDSAILVGVGAAFRFLIGEYRHPPKLVQACGLEGVFWRFPRHPFEAVKWYGYHGILCGSLLAGALTKRVLRSGSLQHHGVRSHF